MSSGVQKFPPCCPQCHAGCRALIPEECNFGLLQPIFLPPSAVSIPRTEVPMEAIIGVHVRPPPSQRDFGCRKLLSMNRQQDRLPPLSLLPKHVPQGLVRLCAVVDYQLVSYEQARSDDAMGCTSEVASSIWLLTHAVKFIRLRVP